MNYLQDTTQVNRLTEQNEVLTGKVDSLSALVNTMHDEVIRLGAASEFYTTGLEVQTGWFSTITTAVIGLVALIAWNQLIGPVRNMKKKLKRVTDDFTKLKATNTTNVYLLKAEVYRSFFITSSGEKNFIKAIIWGVRSIDESLSMTWNKANRDDNAVIAAEIIEECFNFSKICIDKGMKFINNELLDEVKSILLKHKYDERIKDTKIQELEQLVSAKMVSLPEPQSLK